MPRELKEVIEELKKEGIEAAKAEALAGELSCRVLDLDAVGREPADALVNTTSVGMTPHAEGIVVPPERLPAFDVVMDIVYAPLETRLLREARRAGCRCVDGLQMLLYQGAAQFKIWTGRQPPVAAMRRALEEALARQEGGCS